MNSGSVPTSMSAKSTPMRGRPPTCTSSVGARGRVGHDVVAQAVDERRSCSRPVATSSGTTCDQRGVAVRARDRRADDRDAGRLGDRLAADVDHRVDVVAGRRRRCDEEQRAVEARAETLGEQVVGRAGRVDCRVVAGVGDAEAQARRPGSARTSRIDESDRRAAATGAAGRVRLQRSQKVSLDAVALLATRRTAELVDRCGRRTRAARAAA